jgi:hypothetical protein
MRSKLFSLFAVLVVTMLAFATPTEAATYSLVIDDTATPHPVDVIFDEKDITPGYTSNYQVSIDNRLPTNAKLTLDSTVESAPQSSSLLDEIIFTISYNGDILTSGKHSSAELTNQELICVPAQSLDVLDIQLKFNESASNALQATSFGLLFNFSVTDEACSITSDGDDGGPKWPLPPNTGEENILPPTNENSVVLYSSIGVIIVSLFFTLLFGLLVLFGKKRREEDDAKRPNSKPVYTPKTKGGLEIGRDKKR